MNSQEYWAKREAEALKHRITDEREYEKQIKQIYSNMLDECQSHINAFYGKYADKEGISLSEAKKRVRELDIKAYERKAKRYVAEKDFSPKANEEMRLYNATMKINRLEMLKANIGLELIDGHDQLEKFMGDILKGRTEDELKRQAGILGKTVKNNAKKAHAIVNGSFHSGTFSDRIWQYQDLMREDLGRLLQTGLIQGKNPRAITKDLKKYWYGADPKTGGGAVYCMERLMRTELARVQTEAQKQSFERNGFDEYEFIVNGGCCPLCEALKGKHFKVEKMMPGENAPPMHPNCRCSTAAWADRKEYNEWLDFLEKGGTTKEFNLMKALKEKKPLTNNSKNGIISPKNSSNNSLDIAGINTTVRLGKHSFSDGTDRNTPPVDAVIYETADGVKFIFPKNYDTARQRMTPEQAIKAWHKVPEGIRRQAQKIIEVVDYYNPEDAKWASEYANFGEHSYATGGDKITFYRYEFDHDIDYMVRTYCHEAAHYIDAHLASTRKHFSEEALWRKAMSDDAWLSGKKSCTPYGDNAPWEDFAESMANYNEDKDEFIREFPNRAAILSKIIQ